jgi:Protein of unknown function (DUF2563)
MFVDTDLLHSGAVESRRGGSQAGDGATHLAQTSPAVGMFGDFDAAHDFHQAVAQAHAGHTAQLRTHRDTLHTIGDKVVTIAAAFTETERDNTARVKAVGCNSNT